MTRLAGSLLLAAGLAVVVWLEVSNATRDELATPRTQMAAAAPPLSAPSADHTGDWVTTALARPLFSPNRRAAAEVATVGGGRSVPGLPRLAGILVGPFGRTAIFATDGPKPIVVREGERVAAYTVKSIEATQVRLTGPDGTQVLYPSFAAAAAPTRRVGQAAPPR
jgi:hypothetical protein